MAIHTDYIHEYDKDIYYSIVAEIEEILEKELPEYDDDAAEIAQHIIDSFEKYLESEFINRGVEKEDWVWEVNQWYNSNDFYEDVKSYLEIDE